MITNRKGLSDVVTTVLIILLVVAAVAVLWSFLQPFLLKTGSAIQKGQICIENKIEPVSCTKTTASGVPVFNIVYRGVWSSDDIKSAGVPAISLIQADGASATVAPATAPIPTNGGTKSVTATLSGATATAKEVSITTEFTLADTTKKICTSVALACDNT